MKGGFYNMVDFLDMKVMRYWSFPSSYSPQKRRDTVNEVIWSGDYIASEKKDGYFEMIHKDSDGKVWMRARSKGVNGWVFKQDWIPHINPFFETLPNETTLLTEVYLEGFTSRKITTILGCGVEKAIARQEDTPLKMWVFDVLQYDGLDLRNRPISERVKYIDKLDASSCEYVNLAVYWDEPEEIHEKWLEILAKGGEGIMLTKADYPYEPKKRKARATLKLKKELADTVDVFLTGVWKEPTKLYTGKDPDSWEYWFDESAEKRVQGSPSTRVSMDYLTPVTRLWYYGMAGAVEIAMMINGEETPVGWISGIDDEFRRGIVKNPAEYVGKVVEIQAMEVNVEDGIPAFRHARIVGMRPDKNKEDCDWIE